MKVYIDQGVDQKKIKALAKKYNFEIVQNDTEQQFRKINKVNKAFTLDSSTLDGPDVIADDKINDLKRVVGGGERRSDNGHIYSAYLNQCNYFITENPRDFINHDKKEALEKILYPLKIRRLDDFVKEVSNVEDQQMLVKIIDKNDFLNIIVYYPTKEDTDWIGLKDRVSEYFQGIYQHHITVKNVAEYLLKKVGKKNPLERNIFELYNNFSIEQFKVEPIETCPTPEDNSSQLFLRGGNKKSIAYAMKLLNNELNFENIVSMHLLYFTRSDNNNLAGLPTTKGKIVLKKLKSPKERHER
jgi:hypothetical protein